MSKFIIEIEEGKTKCADCPFSTENNLYLDGYACNIKAAYGLNIDCSKYDLSTMIVTEKIEE